MLAKSTVELNVEGALLAVKDMVQWLDEAVEHPTAAHVVERELFRRVMEMGRQLFGAFVKAVGNGDLGSEVTLERPDCPGSRVAKRFAEEHRRKLRTIFGEFSLSRCVYGQGERKAIEFALTDQRLQLPESEISYLLQEWDQLLGINQAFGAVRKTMESILQIKQSVDTLEQGSQQMAESAEAFRAQQPAPEAQTEGELLVVTEDNKGIPMVRPADVLPPGAHLTKGQKKNKKKLACVGCVYTVDRHVRTPEELVATLFRDADRPTLTPPPSKHRRYWARLTRDVVNADGNIEEINGQRDIFEHLREDISLRRKGHQMLLNLSDGQRSLQTDRDEYLAAGYPIATGVIEGACRHIIKDRMERTGMRWKIAGAQAMLELRTIHTNGDWESFQNFRITRETNRLYPYTAV